MCTFNILNILNKKTRSSAKQIRRFHMRFYVQVSLKCKFARSLPFNAVYCRLCPLPVIFVTFRTESRLNEI